MIALSEDDPVTTWMLILLMPVRLTVVCVHTAHTKQDWTKQAMNAYIILGHDNECMKLDHAMKFTHNSSQDPTRKGIRFPTSTQA